MGRGPGADLSLLLRCASAPLRGPVGFASVSAVLLRPGNPPPRVARRAHAGRRPRQFAARADHGAGEIDAGTNPQARARARRAGGLPAQYRFHRGIEGRSGGVSGAAEISLLEAPIPNAALDQLASVLVDCVEGGA